MGAAGRQVPYFNTFYLLLHVGKLKIYFQYVWFDSSVSSYTKAKMFIFREFTASLCGAACFQIRKEFSPAPVRDIAKPEGEYLDFFIS